MKKVNVVFSSLICVSILVTLVFSFIPTTEARILPDWSYDKLMEKSDLVIIVKHIKTEKTGMKLKLSKLYDFKFPEIKSKLKILCVIKGDKKLKEIDVIHLDYPENPKIGFANGPNFIYFRDQNTEYKGKIEGTDGFLLIIPKGHKNEIDYLIFLKKKDNKYIPVSGFFDAFLSIKKLAGFWSDLCI